MWHFREFEVFFWLSDFLFNGFDNNYELIDIRKEDDNIEITYKD